MKYELLSIAGKELDIKCPDKDKLWTFSIPRVQPLNDTIVYVKFLQQTIIPLIDKLKKIGIDYYHFFSHGSDLDIRIIIKNKRQDRKVRKLLKDNGINENSLQKCPYNEPERGGELGAQILLRWYHAQAERVIEVIRALEWIENNPNVSNDEKNLLYNGLLQVPLYMEHMLLNAWGYSQWMELQRAIEKVSGISLISAERYTEAWRNLKPQLLQHLEQMKKNLGKLDKFYRVLHSSVYIRRWDNREFNSSHLEGPAEWYKIWDQTQSTKPEDYPLECKRGIYIEESRITFIELMQKYERDKIIPTAELDRIKLAGVCAFETPQEALAYAGSASYPDTCLVEFIGLYLCPAPEYGGVVAQVIKPLGEQIPLNEFKVKYNL